MNKIFQKQDIEYIVDKNMLNTDEHYMRRCIELALCGENGVRPNPMVGAVIVCNGRIIGEGFHCCYGSSHAEVNAFLSVKKADQELLPESTLYVSLEPCAHYGKTPPCAELIVKKSVKRVVVGCLDVFAKVQGRGIEILKHAGIDVSVGVLKNECQKLNRRFNTYHKLHRPYIILKWATTANGYIDDNYKACQISSWFTKMLVHRLRAENDAILIGHVTEEREHPLLNVREWAGKSPKKIVLSKNTSISNILNTLYQELLLSLVVEGGKTTLQSFIDNNLWDEIRIEQAPMVVTGGTAAPLLPHEAYLAESVCYDGRLIQTYYKSEV